MVRLIRNALIFSAFAVFAAGSMVVNAQTPPSNLIFSPSPTACTINLNWGLGAYPRTDIHRVLPQSGLCNFFFAPIVTTTQVGITSYSDSFLSPGIKYCYQVRSTSTLIGSPSIWVPALPNPTASATTVMVMPPVLSTTKPLIEFASATDSGATVTLRLGTTTVTFPDPDTAFYDFYRDGVAIPNATSVPAYFSGTYLTLFRDTNVPAGLHYYQVRVGEKPVDCNISSARRTAATPSTGNPVKGLGIPLTPGNFTGSYTPTTIEGAIGEVNLSWTDNSGPTNATAYYLQLWRLQEGSPTYEFHKQLDTTTGAYTEATTSLRMNTTYSYKLRTCAQTGLTIACSDYTPEVTVTVSDGVQDVRARMYYASSQGTADILLTWKNNFPDNDYVIQRAVNTVNTTDGVWEDIPGGSISGGGGSPVMEYRDIGVPLGNFYRYKVAVNTGSTLTDPVLSSTVNTRVTKIFSGQAYNSVGSGYLSFRLPPRSPTYRFGVQRTFAQTPVPYSDGGAGWIDFNSELAPGGNAHHYSVQVDEAGLLSGVAWTGISTDPSGSDDSYRYGWLSFNRDDLFGCPGRAPNISCEARYDAATGKFSGWARFIAFENGGTEAGNYWDGWVSLTSFGANPHPYGFDLVAALGKLQGTTWGGLLGWTGVGVCTDVGHPCDVVVTSRTNTALVRNVRVTEGGTMAGRVGSSWCASSSAYIVDWTYTDSANPAKTVADKVDVEFYPVLGVGKIASGTYTGISAFRFEMPMGTSQNKLDYDTDYRARVRAFDTASTAWTAWSDSPRFHTPTHYYPFVDFKSKYNGMNLSGQYQFGFDGTSTLDRSSGSYPVDGWAWNWEFGTDTTELGIPPFATGDRTPSSAFYQDILHPVTLTVDDGGGGVCSYTRDVSTSTTDFGTGGTIRRIWVEP